MRPTLGNSGANIHVGLEKGDLSRAHDHLTKPKRKGRLSISNWDDLEYGKRSRKI